MDTLYIASGNKNKIKEIQNILTIPLRHIAVELDEIQAIDPEDIIRHKAEQAYGLTQKPVIVEDTGLHFDAWDSFPGAMIKWFMKTVDNDGVCRMLKDWDNRKAVAKTVLGFHDGKKTHVFIGELIGSIAESPRGDNGFGWDKIFIPENSDKTFAEMEESEKNKMSMRKKATKKLSSFLESL